ncbi:MAG TPA: hypothetical protein VM243_13155 [Phycisphaerae bacterium]|nr:hypothetical protein [Phycisphaerae bacterium]
MKAGRRQELKTNELAQTLEELRDFFRNYGNYVVGAIVVVGAAVLVWFYLQYTAREGLADAQRQARALPYDTDADVRSSGKKLQELAAGFEDELFLVQTLQSRALMAMSRARVAEDGTPAPEFLDLAAEAYEELLQRVPHRTLEKGAALFGLATVEADRFVLDRDPSHKDNARQYLERIRDAAEFNGTPLKARALEQLNALDDVFVIVALAAPLPPPTATPVPTTPVSPPGTPPFVTVTPATPGQADPTDAQVSPRVHPDAPNATVRQQGVEVIPLSRDEVPPEIRRLTPRPPEEPEPTADQSEETTVDETADAADTPEQSPPPTEDDSENQPE